jgi:hypothetical protein
MNHENYERKLTNILLGRVVSQNLCASPNMIGVGVA